MNDERYPVIIEVTTQHVVWVHANSQGDAVEQAKQTPFYEVTSDSETAVTWWSRAAAPTEYDWDTVYCDQWGTDGSYIGREANAHVEWHKHHLQMQQWAAEKAACTEAGHPDAHEPLSDGRTWCPGCREYLPAPVAAEGGERS